MNIAVYLGSSFPKDQEIVEVTRQLGIWIASHHHTLVYGGSHSGMMGILADAVLENQGEVIGVMPTFLIDRNRAMKQISKFIEVETMSERKTKMISLAGVFIALPGGPGTIEEISEVISGIRLNIIHGKCIIWNINGYYDALQAQYQVMVEQGLLTKEEFDQIYFIHSFEELEKVI